MTQIDNIPTQRTAENVADLVENIDASYARLAKESETSLDEGPFLWFASNGAKLSPALLSPEHAANFALDHFGSDYDVTVQEGNIGVCHKLVGDYHWYQPTTPNRPPLMWFRGGDMNGIPGDGMLGDGDEIWFTCSQVVERLAGMLGNSSATAVEPDRVRTVGVDGHPTMWHGTRMIPEDVVVEHIETLRLQGPSELTARQWEALCDLLEAQAERAGVRVRENAADTLMVRMVAQ